MKSKPVRTPSRIMADMIECAMLCQSETRQSIAKKMGISINTVCADLKEPERIPQSRLWMYFTVLGAPMQSALESVAKEFALSAVKR